MAGHFFLEVTGRDRSLLASLQTMSITMTVPHDDDDDDDEDDDDGDDDDDDALS